MQEEIGLGFTMRSLSVTFILAFCLLGCQVKNEFPKYMAKVKPGMAYEQVLKLIPQKYIQTPREALKSKTMAPFTRVVSKEAIPFYRMYLAADPGEDGMASAILYFDKSNKVIGLNYGSSGAGGWRPKWGHEYSGQTSSKK